MTINIDKNYKTSIKMNKSQKMFIDERNIIKNEWSAKNIPFD